MPLNNEIDTLNIHNIDNDIRDSATRSMIAGEEKESYSTHDYAKNQYLIWSDRKLYKVIAPISTGDTLTVGTNIRFVGTLGDEIYNLYISSDDGIKDLISNVEETNASKAYYFGDYIILASDTLLYKVTTNVSLGTAWAVGTNLEHVDNITTLISALNTGVHRTKQVIATVETSDRASKSYEIGDQFIFGSNLCEATAHIEQQATIVIGTNCKVADKPVIDQVIDLAKAVRNSNRKFVLIGDSFSCGIVDATTPWTDGWIDYFQSIFPNKTFRYDPEFDEQLSGLSSFTSGSQANFINQLNYIYNNKMGTTNPEEITDVVVLGGTNEGNDKSVADLTAAITTFCARARTLYPNAEIAIGIVGLHGRHMVYENNTYKGYRNGAQVNGCKFLDSCINLGTLTRYNSGYNHWSIEGYNTYNPYIAEMIIKGDCDYDFVEVFENLPIVSSDVQFEYGISFQFNLQVHIHPKFITMGLYTNSGYMNGYIDTVTKMNEYGSTRQGKMLELPASLYPFDYVYALGAAIFTGELLWTSHGRDPIWAGKIELRIMTDNGKSYITYRGSHPLTGPSGREEYYSSTLLWNTTSEVVPSFIEY